MISIIKRSQLGPIVEAGTIVFWRGIASEIPNGWSILSSSGERFIQGAATANMTAQGTSTHTHTNPSTGSVGTHRHWCTPRTNSSLSGSAGNRGPGTWGAAANHSHSGHDVWSSYAGDHSHTTGNTNSASHLPAYTRLYLIKSNARLPLPPGAIVMFKNNLSTRPEGFERCTGGTFEGILSPNLSSRFVYTATQDSQVRTTGGADTHGHTQPNTGLAGGHGHTMSGSSGYGGADQDVYGLPEGAVSASPGSHFHNWTADTTADPNHSHSMPNTGTAANVPPCLRLYYLMMVKPKVSKLPAGTVIMWDNANTIPTGWSILTQANGRFIHGAISDAEVMTTVDNPSHTHSQASANSRASHNHGGYGEIGLWSYNGEYSNVYQYSPGLSTATQHGHEGGSLNVDSRDAHGHTTSPTGSFTHTPINVRLIFIVKN